MPLPGTKQVCGAKTRKGTSCQNPAMKNGRCRMHGGASLKGTDLPQFKSGRYSRSMPDRLVGRYRDALADEERYDLRDEISLAEAKIDDLLSKMVRGESDSGWLYLREVERKVQRDRSEDKPDHMRELIRVIRQGAGVERRGAVDREEAAPRRERHEGGADQAGDGLRRGGHGARGGDTGLDKAAR